MNQIGLKKIENLQQTPIIFNPNQESSYSHREKPDKSERLAKSSITSEKFHKKTLDNRQIYDNNIYTKIKSLERQDYSAFLRITLNFSSDKHGNFLSIDITDDQNPYFYLTRLFLFTFLLREQDYSMLKNEQKFTIEFQKFPDSLIDYFQKCEQNNKSEALQAWLKEIKKTGDATLNIMQVNKYKQNLQLQLKFKSSSDEQIKNYLSAKFTKQKQHNDQLSIKVQQLLNQNQGLKQSLHQLDSCYKQLKNQRQSKIKQLQNQEQKKLNLIKEQNIQKETLLKQSFENDHKQLKKKYQQQLDQLNQKYKSLRQNNESMIEKLLNLQSREKQLTNKCKQQEKQLEFINKGYEDVKSENRSLQQIKYQNQKSLIQYKHKIETLQNQLQDRDRLLNTNDQLKNQSLSEKNSILQKLGEVKKQLQKKEGKLSKATQQLIKANGIIQQLKQKYQKRKQKINQKCEVIKQNDKVISELQKEIKSKQSLIEETKRQKDKFEIKIRQQEISIKELKASNQRITKQLEQNLAVIQYMHKQKNQNKFGKGLPISSHIASLHMSQHYSYKPYQEKKLQISKNSIYGNQSSSLGLVSNVESSLAKKYPLTANKSPIKSEKMEIQKEKEYCPTPNNKPPIPQGDLSPYIQPNRPIKYRNPNNY